MPDPTTLRVVIADDERPARRLLAATLASMPRVQLVGEAAGGAEAIVVIERERPDLALLDIQMPEIDGLSVVQLLRPDCRPLIVFVTAYDEYTTDALKVNPLDFLLKPVDPDRLRKTIERARALAGAKSRSRSAP
jgi:two-component system, LytTR family, response regulator